MPHDKILLEGMQFYASHGYNPEEKALGQPFRVDLEAEMDVQAAGRSDSLKDTVSYSHLYETVREVVEDWLRNRGAMETDRYQSTAQARLRVDPQVTACAGN